MSSSGDVKQQQDDHENDDGADTLQGQLLALINKYQQNRGRVPFRGQHQRRDQTPRRPPGMDKTPSRDRRDVCCGNCGNKGHASGECKKEKFPFEKRLCHKAKEPSSGAGDELTEAYAALGVKSS